MQRELKDPVYCQASTKVVRSVAIICCSASVSMGSVYYLGRSDVFAQCFPLRQSGLGADLELASWVWWVAWIMIGYVAVPALTVRFLLGERIRDFHLTVCSLRRHLLRYAAILGIVLPVILVASKNPAFRTYYPMYQWAGRSWPDLLIWEGLYALQFFGVEFFFRGFLLHGLARNIGPAAIFVAVMPYSMVHFGKPWMEVVASIAAGSVLGWLALETKSIWGGVFVHVTAAWTMDVLALVEKHQLPWLRNSML